MKHYNTKFIRKYIKDHKDQIILVKCGMREDWLWSKNTVFENGKFRKGFNWRRKYLEVAGIAGSTWATPVMEVWFSDNVKQVIECWVDDGEDAPEDKED